MVRWFPAFLSLQTWMIVGSVCLIGCWHRGLALIMRARNGPASQPHRLSDSTKVLYEQRLQSPKFIHAAIFVLIVPFCLRTPYVTASVTESAGGLPTFDWSVLFPKSCLKSEMK